MGNDDLRRYAERAWQWRKEADQASSEVERDRCRVIAEGYERLVEIISAGNKRNR